MVSRRFSALTTPEDIVLLARFFTAPEAKEIGPVNQILPAEELLSFALDTAGAIAAKLPQAITRTRALIKGDLEPILARKAKEEALFAERRRSPKAQSIFAAFLARTSRWRAV